MTGIPPYGCRRVGKGREARYEINKEEAEVVKMMFQWYTEGDGVNGPLSLRGIANKLDDLGISPPSYRPTKMSIRWHPNTVRVILINPIHTGLLIMVR